MLVAEGVGRTLHPGVNMGELARPMIEGWMMQNLGPQAKIKETVGSAIATLERLPRLLAQTEQTYSAMLSGGLKLHPDTVAAMRGEGRRKSLPGWLPWVLVAALGALYLWK
jgi:ubiquinone biosynthesis protein